jgi:hypothetical protein
LFLDINLVSVSYDGMAFYYYQGMLLLSMIFCAVFEH